MRFAALVLLFAGGWTNLHAGGPVPPIFQQRLEQFVKIKQAAVRSVAPLGKKASPQEISAREQALGAAIRSARPDAKPGDILTPDSRPVFQRELKDVFTGPGSKEMRAAVKEGNPRHEQVPGEVEPVVKVNAVYPKNAPLSTVPPSVLSRLPALPKDLEYRFVGRTLILRDRESNLIIDFMKEAIPAL